MKVRVGTEYIFYPNLLDRIDGIPSLTPGLVVKVVNLHGAPKANTMGHCYIADRVTGVFIGMVSTNSLYSMSDARRVIDALHRDLARRDAAGSR